MAPDPNKKQTGAPASPEKPEPQKAEKTENLENLPPKDFGEKAKELWEASKENAKSAGEKIEEYTKKGMEKATEIMKGHSTFKKLGLLAGIAAGAYIGYKAIKKVTGYFADALSGIVGKGKETKEKVDAQKSSTVDKILKYAFGGAVAAGLGYLGLKLLPKDWQKKLGVEKIGEKAKSAVDTAKEKAKEVKDKLEHRKERKFDEKADKRAEKYGYERDKDYDAETFANIEKNNMGVVDQYIYKLLRYYFRYSKEDGYVNNPGINEKYLRGLMEKLESGEKLTVKECKEVLLQLKVGDGLAFHIQHGVLSFITMGGNFVVQMAKNEAELIIKLLGIPLMKDEAWSESWDQYANTVLFVAPYAGIHAFYQEWKRARSLNLEHGMNFRTGAKTFVKNTLGWPGWVMKAIWGAPNFMVKVINNRLSTPIGYLFGKVKGDKMEITFTDPNKNVIGKIYEKAKDWAGIGKKAKGPEATIKPGEIKAEEFEKLETKEKVKTIKKIDEEILYKMAETDEKKYNVDIQMEKDLEKAKSKTEKDAIIQKAKSDKAGFQAQLETSMKDLYKKRIEFTGNLHKADPHIIEKEKIHIDDAFIRKHNLNLDFGDLPVKKGAFKESVKNMKLHGVLKLQAARRHVKSVVQLATILLIGYFGAKYLITDDKDMEESKEEEEEAKKKLNNSEAAKEKSKEEVLNEAFDIRRTMQNHCDGFKEIYEYLGDPEKLQKLSPEEQDSLINRTILIHNASLPKIKRTYLLHADIINETYKKNPDKQKEILFINPFVKIRYDEDNQKAFLEYASDAELKEKIYQIIDYAGKDGWEVAGEMAQDIAPVWGTFRDFKRAWRNWGRGNAGQATADSLWGVFGVISDGLTFGAGKALIKGAAKGGKAVSIGAKMAKGGKIGEKALSAFEKYGGKIVIGTIAFDLGRQGAQVLGWLGNEEFKGKFDGTEKEIEANAPDMFHIDLSPMNTKEEYEKTIEKMRYDLIWRNMKYEIIDDKTVIIKRAHSGESIKLKRHSKEKPFIQDNKSTGIWELEGIGKAYDSFAQAVAIANLINKTAEIIKKNDYEGGSDEPFHMDGDNIDFDVSWDNWRTVTKGGADLTVLSKDQKMEVMNPASWNNKKHVSWLQLFNEDLDIPTNWIVNALNAWYKNKYKK